MRIVLLALVAALASPAQAIVGPSRDGDDYADRVVMVLARHGARQSVCSGVALAPRLVLTAAHCLAAPGDTLVAARRDGATVPIPVAAVARHPGYDPDATRARRRSIDLALVRTAAPLEGFRYAEIGEAPAQGAPVIAVGFGVRQENGAPSDGHIRRADLAVTAPLSQVVLWTADPQGRELGACHGDSGGPIFDAEGKVVAVVAWTNGRSGRGCGAITQGPLAAPARGWIEAIRARWGD
jgi:S1-C subfamily serine protease